MAVVTDDDRSSTTRSRYCQAVVQVPSFVDDPDAAIAALSSWARAQPSRPVIFCQGDHDLLAVSRHREELARHAHVPMPPAELVESLVDKLRFAELAARLDLPVPKTTILRRDGTGVEGWSHFPCVLKPAMRTHWFDSELLATFAGSSPKALRVESREELDRILPAIAKCATDFVVQAAIEGGEENILSYHAYVRPNGAIVAEFTGKKLRTTPRRYGISTYVEIRRDGPVIAAGRLVLEKLGFHGVLKMDFKQDPNDGRLHLLEINPRFSLWHHPATLAGFCVPELVYRDCVEPGSARCDARGEIGVRWISSRQDFRAAREYRAAGELGIARWLAQVARAHVDEDLSFRDPVPTFIELANVARRKLSFARRI